MKMEITWQKFPVGYFEIYLHWHNCQVCCDPRGTTKKRRAHTQRSREIDYPLWFCNEFDSILRCCFSSASTAHTAARWLDQSKRSWWCSHRTQMYSANKWVVARETNQNTPHRGERCCPANVRKSSTTLFQLDSRVYTCEKQRTKHTIFLSFAQWFMSLRVYKSLLKQQQKNVYIQAHTTYTVCKNGKKKKSRRRFGCCMCLRSNYLKINSNRASPRENSNRLLFSLLETLLQNLRYFSRKSTERCY